MRTKKSVKRAVTYAMSRKGYKIVSLNNKLIAKYLKF